jgi:hypothetical protein
MRFIAKFLVTKPRLSSRGANGINCFSGMHQIKLKSANNATPMQLDVRGERTESRWER